MGAILIDRKAADCRRIPPTQIKDKKKRLKTEIFPAEAIMAFL